MSSGNMSPREIVETANRLLVAKRSLESIEKYFSPDYVDHNPNTPNGNLEGMLQELRKHGFTEVSPNDRTYELHIDHIIGEGDLVLIHQHITEAGMPTMVFMDLFRVRDRRIVEHWDVIQNAPDNPANKRVTMY